MYVCLCKGITDSQIRELVETTGAQTLREVRAHLGVASQCGKCAMMARDILDQTLANARTADGDTLFYAVA